MRNFFYRHCAWILGLFLTLYFNAQAMPVQEEPWDLVDLSFQEVGYRDIVHKVGVPGINAVTSTTLVKVCFRDAEAEELLKQNQLLSDASVVPSKLRSLSGADTLLQQMKLDVIVEAHKRIAKAYDLRPFEFAEPPSLSNASIELVTKESEQGLYASVANIKQWQILKEILDVIDEYIEKRTKSNSRDPWVMESLNHLRMDFLEQYRNAMLKRELFLEDALKIAAEIRLWVVFNFFYDYGVKSSIPDTLKGARSLLKDKDRVSRCENLYKAQDSITNSLSADLMNCKDFVVKIRELLGPAASEVNEPWWGLVSSIQMESILERKKVEFYDSQDLSLVFNPEDKTLFLKIFERVLNFFGFERAAESQVLLQVSKIEALEELILEAQLELVKAALELEEALVSTESSFDSYSESPSGSESEPESS